MRNANAEAISRAVYFCLKELGAEEQQAAQVEAIRAERGIPAAEEAAREWNVVMALLDQMRCDSLVSAAPSTRSCPHHHVWLD